MIWQAKFSQSHVDHIRRSSASCGEAVPRSAMQPTRRPEAWHDQHKEWNTDYSGKMGKLLHYYWPGRKSTQIIKSNMLWLASHPGQSGAEQLHGLHLYN
jgi:hypothetical protein